jgi:hypothetical protein
MSHKKTVELMPRRGVPGGWHDVWDGPCPIVEARAELEDIDRRRGVSVRRIRQELAEEGLGE